MLRAIVMLSALSLATATWSEADFDLCFVQKDSREPFCLQRGDRYRVDGRLLVIQRRNGLHLPPNSPRAWDLVSLRLKDVDLEATAATMDEQRAAEERRRQSESPPPPDSRAPVSSALFDGDAWVRAEALRAEQEREQWESLSPEARAAVLRQRQHDELIDSLSKLDASLATWGCAELYADDPAAAEACRNGAATP